MLAELREIEIPLIKGSKLTSKFVIPDELGILEDPRQVPPKGFGCFRIMTPKDGDKRITWNNQDFAQIRQAKETFDKLVLEGLVPYRVGTNGQASSEVMPEFDPYSEEIIFLPISLVMGG